MTELRRVGEGEKQLLFNLLQKYLCELTHFYDDDVDADGNYEYAYFEPYFTEPERRAFIIREDGAVAGFVMMNAYSCIGNEVDNAIAEFCVLPKYRRRHVAERAVDQLIRMYKGRWEIKFHDRNIPAMRLWTRVTEQFHPAVSKASDEETVLSFEVQGL